MHLLSVQKSDHNRLIVESYTKFLDELKPTLKQRLWHYNNKTESLIICEICGVNPALWSERNGYITCSKECKNQKIKNTTKAIYGVENYGCTEESRKRSSEQFKDKEFRKVMEAGMKSKYGVSSYGFTHNNINRLTTNNPAKQEDYIDKRISTCKEKYGKDHFSQTDEFKERLKSNYLRTHGTESFFQTEEYKEKAKSTNNKKYGTDYWMQSEQRKMEVLRNICSEIGESYKIIDYNNLEIRVFHTKCGKEFTMHSVTLHRRKRSGAEICNHCNTFINSNEEKELVKFLEQYTNVEVNNRRLIRPFELDAVLPDRKIAVEFNGTYWHSDEIVNNNYHKSKSDLCENLGYKLIHVWEDWWHNDKHIIKSILNGYLGSNTKIFARNCEIKEVSSKIAEPFINNNHIQGYSASKITLGLYNNGHLVQIMSFNPHKAYEWEINRSCTILNTTVVGGFSKLLKHFILRFNPKFILSYVLRDLFTGKSYEKYGFKLIGMTAPGYSWVNDMVRVSRQQCQKHKLLRQGFSGKSENDIMRKRGFRKIYNSGNYKFLLSLAN